MKIEEYQTTKCPNCKTNLICTTKLFLPPDTKYDKALEAYIPEGDGFYFMEFRCPKCFKCWRGER